MYEIRRSVAHVGNLIYFRPVLSRTAKDDGTGVKETIAAIPVHSLAERMQQSLRYSQISSVFTFKGRQDGLVAAHCTNIGFFSA
jgi:hypothetical protein